MKRFEDTLKNAYKLIIRFLLEANKMLKERTIKTMAKAIAKPNALADKVTELQQQRSDIMSGANSWMSGLIQDLNAKTNKVLQDIDENKRIRRDLDGEKSGKILKWISPVVVEDDHAGAHEGHIKGTGEWLKTDPSFEKWADQTESSLFWLYGKRKF